MRRLIDRARTGECGSADLELGAGNVRPRRVRLHVQPLWAPGSAPARLLVMIDDAPPAGAEARGEPRPDEGSAPDDIVARAAHELRGPLGSISNWVHLLSQRSKDAALQEQGLTAIQRRRWAPAS